VSVTELHAGHGIAVLSRQRAGSPAHRPLVASGHGYELCLVRRGCFRLRGSRHVGVLADPRTCVMGGPGHVVEISHPSSAGNEDTFIRLSEPLLGRLVGDDPELPSSAYVTPAMALLHVRLLAATRHDVDPPAVEELALELLSAAIEQTEPTRVAAGRPADDRRRRLADDARAALAANPDLSLVDLAGTLSCSPHHLSRAFVRHTGIGVARHRLTLRVHRALDTLGEGETQLARLAADCGFSDHSHLVRAIRDVLGTTPTAIREALLDGAPISGRSQGRTASSVGRGAIARAPGG